MSEMTLKFPHMYTPTYDTSNISQDLAMFENYESNTKALPIDDREGMREVLREINLDDYKASGINKQLLEITEDKIKDSSLTEDELLTLIQKLRVDGNGTGKSNIEYMSTYNKPSNSKLDKFRASLMAEKEKEEREYYSDVNEYEDYKNYYFPNGNRFLDEIDELK